MRRLIEWARRQRFAPDAAAQIRRRAWCEHEWEYVDGSAEAPYTGFLERCKRCGETVQIPQ